MAILSTIGILLKFNFKPYNHIFTMFILVCQFLTMYIYILFICVYLYRFSFKFVKRRPYRFGNIVATMIAITLTTLVSILIIIRRSGLFMSLFLRHLQYLS